MVNPMEKLTQKELAAMIRAAVGGVKEKKEEINKINVFPVPDQDTGTNLSATLDGINNSIAGKEFPDVHALGETVLEGALTSAQGNAGVIFTGFLAGFFPALDGKEIDAKILAAAFDAGAKRARDSIQNPRSGTILDVIDASAAAIQRLAVSETDIAGIFQEAVKDAQAALMATRDKIEVLKKANVVDAGGLGFLIILESFLDALGAGISQQPFEREERPSEIVRQNIRLDRHRFEVAGLLEAEGNSEKFNEATVQEALKDIGDFIDVVRIGKRMRIHVHTDQPAEAERVIRGFGKAVALRTQDMAKEIGGEEPVTPMTIGIVTEDIADLNQKILERYRITMAKTAITWPEGEKLAGDNLYQKMRVAEKLGIKTFPKTSQASPEQYRDACRAQLENFDRVLCVTISSGLSGSFNSAKVGAGLADAKKTAVFDSRQVSVGQGLIVLRAIELIREGRAMSAIVSELQQTISKVKLYVLFDDPRWIEAGGRLTKSKAAWVRRLKKLRFHPLISVKDGVLTQDGIVFAKNKAEALFKKVAADSAKDRKIGKKIRTVIAHADDETGAKLLKTMLKERIGAEVSYIIMASPTLGVHAGPGSLIVAWTVIS